MLRPADSMLHASAICISPLDYGALVLLTYLLTIASRPMFRTLKRFLPLGKNAILTFMLCDVYFLYFLSIGNRAFNGGF